MAHNHMNHAGMDHGGMDHGGMDHGHMCNMNMLFTWDTTDLCLIFKGWHVHSTWSLIWSLLGVVLLTAGYELVRETTRRYELAINQKLDAIPRPSRTGAEQSAKLAKAALYAVQVFYSFFIMLLFMTYNGWVMLAVAVGAFVGYIMFTPTNSSAQKTVACH